ncbi:MAG: methyltransferase domain-containing protein [Dehalococcoidales bacterium]
MKYRNDIRDFIHIHKPVDPILDYGCGKGLQYVERKVHTEWGVEQPHLYDPAVPQHAERPDYTFDLVLCTDVMEHVPEDMVEATFIDIFSMSHRLVFFSISTRPALQFVGNKENAHATIKPAQWWNDKITLLKPSKLVVKVCCDPPPRETVGSIVTHPAGMS